MSRTQSILGLAAEILQAEESGSSVLERASLEKVAECAGLSPGHVQRIFKEGLGESPMQFARRVVLERAAAQLVQGRAAILEVALDAGFETHEGFARSFRGRFGLSPSQYRKRGLPARGAAAQTAEPEADDVQQARAERHAEVVANSAACLGLYRVSISPTKEDSS